jgi:DedD protein
LDTAVKQRYVGVMVIISLGIIFLPSLFYRDNDERMVVDTQSLIPPKPDVRTIVVVSPERVEQIPAPTPEEAFQPRPAIESSVVEQAKVPSSVKATSKKAPESTLALDSNGLPTSWVIQAASFQSEVHAKTLSDKLRAKKYKAYVRSVKTSKGQFFRVLIGPYIDKQRAQTAKASVDKTYRVKGQILRFSSN